MSAVPALFVGILVMLGLGDALERGGPSHPIIGVALTADWWVWLQVFLVACVVAPLVEEMLLLEA